jgi:hypothetical protein
MPDRGARRISQLVRRLIELEAGTMTPARADNLDSPSFRVCEKLRQPLSRLVGTAGFRALLSRALALAGDEMRWLKAIHIAADGSLEGLDDMLVDVSPHEIGEGEVVLVAQLIGLLVTFIGAGLTMRLLHEAWPHEGFDNMQM